MRCERSRAEGKGKELVVDCIADFSGLPEAGTAFVVEDFDSKSRGEEGRRKKCALDKGANSPRQLSDNSFETRRSMTSDPVISPPIFIAAFETSFSSISRYNNGHSGIVRNYWIINSIFL